MEILGPFPVEPVEALVKELYLAVMERMDRLFLLTLLLVKIARNPLRHPPLVHKLFAREMHPVSSQPVLLYRVAAEPLHHYTSGITTQATAILFLVQH